ncbi:YbgA family protein [Thalassobacillus hwangdonensis]|uniref:YbgA family protein n=1 Tax=Thalassobacillus hwangdonensis TaxID=546108 RepID=A0ABW3L1R2_9BACI
MDHFPRPRVVVSKCLGFDQVRYNGETIPDKVVKRLEPYVEFIPVCPEVEIGLGIPRDVIRIVKDQEVYQLVQPKTGKDLTESMRTFSEQFMQALPAVDGFLLKNRSPTCGVNDAKVYADVENSPVIEKTDGLFTQAVREYFGGVAIEEEGRLKNFTLREHFLTKLFTLAWFRQVKEEGTMKLLVAFHSKNKYLFMAYNQTLLTEMGRLVANPPEMTKEEIMDAYEAKLQEMLDKPAGAGRHINVCQHIFGYFKNGLNSQEKQYFLHELDQYEKEKIPLSAVLGILKAWAVRFEEKYLLQQSYFEPYPIDLVEISDSGKGRAYS